MATTAAPEADYDFVDSLINAAGRVGREMAGEAIVNLVGPGGTARLGSTQVTVTPAASSQYLFVGATVLVVAYFLLRD